MIKMMFAWRDRPDRSAQQCEEHYRTVHMDMARQAFQDADGFLAVVFNRVRSAGVNDYNRPERREVEPDFDSILELYFRDRPSMQKAFTQPQMQRMFEDHPNFMHTDTEANVRIYEVEETVFLGRRDD